MSDVRKFAGDVAAHLGDGWELVPLNPDGAEEHPSLKRQSDGATFWMGTGWQATGRITVHCHWPKDANGREQWPHFSDYSQYGKSAPSISFVATKNPAQAAKDIARRFLPLFLPLWEKRVAEVASMDAHVALEKATVDATATILKGRSYRPHPEDVGSVRDTHHHYPRIQDVRVVSKGEVEVKVRLTQDQLRQLAAIVEETPAEED